MTVRWHRGPVLRRVVGSLFAELLESLAAPRVPGAGAAGTGIPGREDDHDSHSLASAEINRAPLESGPALSAVVQLHWLA